MGRRQGRANRFRIGDAAAVVAAIPPDALHRHCFGVSAGNGLVRDVLGGIDVLRGLAAASDLPAVPLEPASRDEDFRVPDALDPEALQAAVEVLARAEDIAVADAFAIGDAVDNRSVGDVPEKVEKVVSRRSLGDLLRSRLGLPAWWTLPHARISIVNRPGAHSWHVRLASPPRDQLEAMARETVQAFHDALDGNGLLEELAGTMPGGLTSFALPPHGILTRIEYSRVQGEYWLRSAAAVLALHCSRAHRDLPGGMACPDQTGPWIWTGAFGSSAGTGAALARAGAWGRPPVSLLEVEGPFEAGRPVAVSLTPRPTGDDASAVFHSAVGGEV